MRRCVSDCGKRGNGAECISCLGLPVALPLYKLAMKMPICRRNNLAVIMSSQVPSIVTLHHLAADISL
jgi:hypothetical protein